MEEQNPVSLWIEQLRHADEDAARNVWEHFSGRLVAFARRNIRAGTRRLYDEDDAAQSVFRSICTGMLEGRFPDLCHRENLWGLMLVITSQKISNRHRFDQQQRRDIRRTLSDSVFAESQQTDCLLISREPSPDFAIELEETCERLFDSLGDADLKAIAVLRLEGFTDDEIAEKRDCSRRTVQRRMAIIRRHWVDVEIGSE